MRTLLRTPLLTLALTCTTFATTAALACGGPETELPAVRTAAVPVPQLLEISSHREFHTGSETPTRRTFVLLADTGLQPGPHAVWQRIAVNEYDDPQIAAAPALTTPMVVTLITAHGATTVASTKRVFLSDYTTHHKPHLALEVSAPDETMLAVAGRATGKWHAFASIFVGEADQRWLVSHGFTQIPLANMSASDVTGTRLVARSFSLGPDQSTIVIADGERIVVQETGFARGAVEVAGRLYLVVQPGMDEAPLLAPIAR